MATRMVVLDAASVELCFFKTGSGSGSGSREAAKSAEDVGRRPAIIKKNIFGHRWVLKINEPEAASGGGKNRKLALYAAVSGCLAVAVCFGIFFSLGLESLFFQKTGAKNATGDAADVAMATSMRRAETTTATMEKMAAGTKMAVATTTPPAASRPTMCNCTAGEICMKIVEHERPGCVAVTNARDPTGCGGNCKLNTQYCKVLDRGNGVYQCRELKTAALRCPEGAFSCGNRCIERAERCDGVFHCSDHSDETDCDCDLASHFRCGNSTSCLEKRKRCDGRVDCWDKSDESGCHGASCGELEAPCRDGSCLPRRFFCDGTVHCADKSDEPTGC